MAPPDPTIGTNPVTPPPSNTSYRDPNNEHARTLTQADTSASTSEQAQAQSQSDTQPDEQTRRPRRPRPKHDFPETQAGKLWKAFGNPEGGPVNELPGGTYNTAGGRPKEVSWRDAFNFEVMNNPNRPAWYKTGCARDSLLVGIAAGGGVGGLGFIVRGLRRSLATSNYAAATFVLTASGMYYWCEKRRQEEAKGMAAAVVGMRMLHEKKAKDEAERKKQELDRGRREEEERIRNKRWWKPWS